MPDFFHDPASGGSAEPNVQRVEGSISLKHVWEWSRRQYLTVGGDGLHVDRRRSLRTCRFGSSGMDERAVVHGGCPLSQQHQDRDALATSSNSWPVSHSGTPRSEHRRFGQLSSDRRASWRWWPDGLGGRPPSTCRRGPSPLKPRPSTSDARGSDGRTGCSSTSGSSP
jgi:hypothetical protein